MHCPAPSLVNHLTTRLPRCYPQLQPLYPQVTALNNKIGYDKAAAIAKKAHKEVRWRLHELAWGVASWQTYWRVHSLPMLPP